MSSQLRKSAVEIIFRMYERAPPECESGDLVDVFNDVCSLLQIQIDIGLSRVAKFCRIGVSVRVWACYVHIIIIIHSLHADQRALRSRNVSFGLCERVCTYAPNKRIITNHTWSSRAFKFAP